MPSRPTRPCKRAAGGCPEKTGHPSGLCDACRPEVQRAQDRRRGSAASRGYDRRWDKARLRYLAQHPLCECEDCARKGLTTPAEVVDHIIPHRGDRRLFWDRSNWQAMSKACHDRKTARDDGGFGRNAGPRPSE